MLKTRDQSELVNIGRICSAVGLRGEVRVAGDSENLREGKVLLLRRGKQEIEAACTGARYQKNTPIIKIEGITDRNAAEELKGYDIVLIDTAGRSHKSASQRDDLEKLINSIPEEDREVYLVLSVATKYRDLVKICETYKEFTSYRIIFTKLDETTALGNIYNIRQLTGAQLSYVTFGQAVPNDIEKIDAQTIAKQLLGGNE